MTTTEPEAQVRRASPLAPDERRIAIIEAIKPLLVEHGRDVTTRQIAEAAGVAEGTIFRAFADKESLIEAAVTHYLDPEQLMVALRSIELSLPLEVKLSAMITAMSSHFGELFRIMASLGRRQPPRHEQRHEFAKAITEILAPDLERLTLSPERVAHVVRLVTFATAFPRLNEGIEFTVDELTELVLHGILVRPTTDPVH